VATEAPLKAEELPAGQDVQLLDPVEALKVPAPQLVQALAAVAEYLPVATGKHKETPRC